MNGLACPAQARMSGMSGMNAVSVFCAGTALRGSVPKALSAKARHSAALMRRGAANLGGAEDPCRRAERLSKLMVGHKSLRSVILRSLGLHPTHARNQYIQRLLLRSAVVVRVRSTSQEARRLAAPGLRLRAPGPGAHRTSPSASARARGSNSSTLRRRALISMFLGMVVSLVSVGVNRPALFTALP